MSRSKGLAMQLNAANGQQLLARPVCGDALPDWLPLPARHYLEHVAAGRTLRALARAGGCHASTVLRQVRRIEARRDDPLLDEALDRLLRAPGPVVTPVACKKDHTDMTIQARRNALPDSDALESEARRILAPLSEEGAILAVAPDMDRAVVLREGVAGATPERLAVTDRATAHAFVLKDWISCGRAGRVSAYVITEVGRAALRRLRAGDRARGGAMPGLAEAQAPFASQHRDWGCREATGEGGAVTLRYNLLESPVTALARRRDKDGRPFLAPELIAAGERLREDFELAQMGPRVTQNWERFLVAGSSGTNSGPGRGESDGARAARERLQAALAELGPGLGDIALRCCCHLEGLETAERRRGWSARSGKIVLRIALQRLRRHYETRHGRWGPMIG